MVTEMFFMVLVLVNNNPGKNTHKGFKSYLSWFYYSNFTVIVFCWTLQSGGGGKRL